MDFRNDTSSWCAASLSAISLRYLACSSTNWRLCSSCCRSICFCNNSILSSRAATSPCKVRLSASNSFSLPLPKREPTFATSAAFASILAASSFSVLISFRISSNCHSAHCYSTYYCCSLVSSSPVYLIDRSILNGCNIPHQTHTPHYCFAIQSIIVIANQLSRDNTTIHKFDSIHLKVIPLFLRGYSRDFT